MANLREKCSNAKAKFAGRKVRRLFSTKRYSTCTGVNCYGPPSGWTCVYELVLANGSTITVERLSDIVIKPEKANAA